MHLCFQEIVCPDGKRCPEGHLCSTDGRYCIKTGEISFCKPHMSRKTES